MPNYISSKLISTKCFCIICHVCIIGTSCWLQLKLGYPDSGQSENNGYPGPFLSLTSQNPIRDIFGNNVNL